MKLAFFSLFGVFALLSEGRAADFETWTIESHLQITKCQMEQGKDVCHLGGGDPGNVEIPLSECHANPGGSSLCVGYHELVEDEDNVRFHGKLTAMKIGYPNGVTFRVLRAQVGPEGAPDPSELTIKLNESGKLADGFMLDGPPVRPAPGTQYVPTLYIDPPQK